MHVAGRREGDAPQLRVDFDGSSGTTALARDAADAFLATLARTCPPSRASARADVLLAVSELVTNAVRHAPGPLTVRLAVVSDSIHISVRDTSRTHPEPRPPEMTGAGGFGWPILQRLSRRLNVLPLTDGKEIHALLPW